VSGFYGLLVNMVVFVAISLAVGGVSEDTLEDTQGYIDYAISRGWETGGDVTAGDVTTDDD
jgi:hypothetical protein